ncbi:MAG: hypothetical protein K2G27_00705 [Duncaniella sp.]|nr:hypothetical protein [Duncaniella sp.]
MKRQTGGTKLYLTISVLPYHIRRSEQLDTLTIRVIVAVHSLPRGVIIDTSYMIKNKPCGPGQ